MIVLNREVGEALRRDKYVNVRGGDFNLYGHFGDFVRLTKSWENMEPDSYYGQAESGMRFRRYSDFEYNPQTRELKQLEHRAYIQSKANNSYVGGLERHFQDFSNEVINSPVMRSLIDTDFEVYKNVLPQELHDEIWQCQIHQIRIEIKPGKQLEITPEGIHCDGYPFSGVHFWGRHNVAGAESRLYTAQEEQLAATTYEDILDTTFFLDRDMRHYVTPARNIHSHEWRSGRSWRFPSRGPGPLLTLFAEQLVPMDDPEQQVLLRRAMVRDAERMERFFRGFDEVSFCEWQDARFLRGVLLQETTTAYLAIDASGSVVGAVIGGMLGTRGTINHLAVSPRHRTRGLGQRLVEAASADMKRVGVLRMFLFVDDANLAGKRFWAAQGFCEPRGEITFERDL